MKKLTIAAMLFLVGPAAAQPDGWIMTPLDYDIIWSIRSPAQIAKEVVAHGARPGSIAYAQVGGLTIEGRKWCNIVTPPVNSWDDLRIVRHEVAHCELGSYHP